MKREELFDFLKERGYIYQTTNEDEVKKLCNGEPISIYLGIDPTADSLHIGHCFPLVVLRYFQELGHKIVILFGGATAMIGDPTGKKDMRKMVSTDFINNNLAKLKSIVGNFLKLDGDNPVVFVNNYEWFKDLNYVGFMREIGVHFNVNKMLATNIYASRIEEGGLTFFEMGYMLMQAYDFVYLNKHYGVRMEMGGSDQWANILAGADLGRKLAIKEGIDSETFQAFTCPLLLNNEGIKMGKTEKGALWVDKTKTTPFEFYQYFYNQSDADVERLLKYLTPLSFAEIAEIMKGDIREAKRRMAFEITKFIHSEQDAIEAENTAKGLFGGGNDLSNAPEYKISESDLNTKLLIDLLVESGLAVSKSDARRTMEQGGLSLNNDKVTDLKRTILPTDFNDGFALLKKGKKNFIKITK